MFVSRTPFCVGRLRQIFFSHFLVIFKAAGCQNNRFGASNIYIHTILFRLDTHNPFTFNDQIDHLGIQPQGDVFLLHRQYQAPNTRTAAGRLARAFGANTLRDIQKILQH